MTGAASMGANGKIRARCDGGDRLVEADEPLASLQRRCGGDVPGLIAIPALLALVRKSRNQRLRLSRSILALDDGQQISAWAQAEPYGEGTIVELSHWRAATPAADDGVAAAEVSLLYQLADLVARLDAGQKVVFAEAQGPALAGLASEMAEAPGRHWSEFVTLGDMGANQPLHWRLADGAHVSVPGHPGRWQARLLPQAGAGFELFLVPEAIDSVPGSGSASQEGAEGGYTALLARELGPALVQPISRIVANAETIRTRLAGPLAEEYSGYAADIAEAGRHLLGLVRDLADLDAIEAESFTTAPDAIDLGDCARRAAGILSVRAAEREIALAVPPEQTPVPATGEERRVLQVLLNLISNAIRYSPEGTTVTLRCGSDGEWARVSVEDEGEGIAPEQAAKVFNKFERLGRSGDGGSGLGLYISRRLARAMGGDLTVASTPGEGACFTLTLPARD